MYAALLNRKLVLAVEEERLVKLKKRRLNQQQYRCPHCQKRVILVISQTKAAFFKHLRHYYNGKGEKEEHHNSKLLLKAAFTALGFDAQTEIPLAEGQIRSDVLVSPKLSLEVQCAPLSLEEYSHRHALYHQIGVLDLWIVGKRHYLKRKLKKTQLIFFRRNKKWGNYYLEVDPNQQILRLKYHILQAPISNNLVYQTQVFSLDEIGIKKFWHFKPKFYNYYLNVENQKQYLTYQIRQSSKFGQRIASQLYEHHLTVDDLPEKVFITWRHPGSKDQITNFLANYHLNES